MAKATEQREDALAEPQPEPQAAPVALAPAPSVASILQLQRSAGNQAVQRMLAPARPTIQRMSAIDVLAEVVETGDWTEAKKRARSKEIRKKNKAIKPKTADKQAAKEVDAADKSAEQIKAGSIITVADWVVMKKGLTQGEYEDVIKAFDKWTGDPAQKEDFLDKLPTGKLYLFNSLVASKPGATGPLKKQIVGTPNAARAEQARKELTALQKKSGKAKARLTDPIVALLVFGVAERRAAGDLGQEGIIGIEHALDAGEALIAMSTAAYLDTVLKLDLTGGWFPTWDERRVESALILKAVAARKSEYQKDEAAARKAVGGFAEDIRGEDTAKLTEQTSTRDIGGKTGLQQKFTMSCGPTSIQIVRGEADPVFALDVSKTAKHTLDYKNMVGDEQEKLLGHAAAPRLLKTRWDAFKAALSGLTIDPADLPKWQALLSWFGGGSPDATALAGGQALATGLGFPAAELADFRKYQTGLNTEPGLTVPEFQQRIQAAKLAGITNDSYPLKQFTAANRPKESDLDEMWKILFRGQDILIGVIWSGGGGHYMTLTDVRGDPKAAASTRDFMLSDPWEGDSQWLTGANLAAGNFGTTGTGFIDDIYY